MGSVEILPQTPEPFLPKEKKENKQSVAVALYRHDCANKFGHGPKCPSRWSKFAAHEAEQAKLEQEVMLEPIVHRHCFNANDKKCMSMRGHFGCQTPFC